MSVLMQMWYGFAASLAILGQVGRIDAQSMRSAKTVSAGDAHTCAILDDNTVKCFGMGWYGQLGSELTANYGDAPSRIGAYLPTPNPKQLAAGGYHTCAIDDHGNNCFMFDSAADTGQQYQTFQIWKRANATWDGPFNTDIPGSGLGGSVETSLGSCQQRCANHQNCQAIQYSSTDAHDALKCFGLGRYGQLGLESKVDVGSKAAEMGGNLPIVDLGIRRTVKQVTAGSYDTCAILDDDTLKCFGYGQYGQLGLESDKDVGRSASEMGDYLPVVDLGNGKTVKHVAAGSYHTCAVLDDDTLKCFGFGRYGQLGSESNANIGTRVNEMGDSLPIVDLGSGRNVKQVAAGSYHTCVLLNDGALKCFGFGQYGQLGSESKANIGSSADELGDNLPIADLGTGRTVKQVAAGSYHVCVVLDDDTLKCFGLGQHGQLGSESRNDIGSSADEMGDNLPTVDLGSGRTVKQVAAAGYHTCVVLDNEILKCFGFGQYGQLGSESKANIGSRANEMGDSLGDVVLQVTLTSCRGQNDGCIDIGEGDGDCDLDEECAVGLRCGVDTCLRYRNSTGWVRDSDGFDLTDDCCVPEPSNESTCWKGLNNYEQGLTRWDDAAPHNFTLLTSEPNITDIPEPCLLSSLALRFYGSAMFLIDQPAHDLRYMTQGVLDCLFRGLAKIIVTSISVIGCEWRIEFFFPFIAESDFVPKQTLTLLESFATNSSRIRDMIPSCLDEMMAKATNLEMRLGLQIFKAQQDNVEYIFDERWPDKACTRATTSSPSATTTTTTKDNINALSTTDSTDTLTTTSTSVDGMPASDYGDTSSANIVFPLPAETLYMLISVVLFSASQ